MTAEYRFSARSLQALEGVNPILKEVAHQALLLSEIDFGVISGVRTEEEQRHLVAIGASKTMKSKHLTGDAIDIMAWIDGRPCWEVGPYKMIHPAFQQAADNLNVSLTWGGTWGWDFGHYEIKSGA